MTALAFALALAVDQAAARAQQAPPNAVATVFPSVIETDRRAFMASFIDRLGPSCLEKGARLEADPAFATPTAWGRGFYRSDDISEGGGATAGFEFHPDRRTCAGVGFNYANTSLALDGLPQSGEVAAFSLGAYARRDGKLIFVDGAFAATFADIDSKRRVSGLVAKGSTEATGAGIVAGIGLVLHAGLIVLEPRFGLDYDHGHQDGYAEHGAGVADLRVSSGEHDGFRSNLGLRLHRVFDLPSGAGFMPEFSIAWAHNLIDQGVTLTERPAGSPGAFHVAGDKPPADFLLLGAGLSFHPNGSDEIFVRYDGAWAEDDIHADAVSAGGKLRW
ncbi:MAG TPA: autotransporter outer membrane beta-barrel domain-containing protein [Methyloceanibacter sp.]|nr:autotransporter outer membrane beta-barrel domain-containing protein [Methyloceanibacter sp.]